LSWQFANLIPIPILLLTKEYYLGFLNRLKTTKAAALIPIVNLISAAVYFIDFFNLLIVPLAIHVLLRYFRKNSRAPVHLVFILTLPPSHAKSLLSLSVQQSAIKWVSMADTLKHAFARQMAVRAGKLGALLYQNVTLGSCANTPSVTCRRNNWALTCALATKAVGP
jgi:hypothetical protein